MKQPMSSIGAVASSPARSCSAKTAKLARDREALPPLLWPAGSHSLKEPACRCSFGDAHRFGSLAQAGELEVDLLGLDTPPLGESSRAARARFRGRSRGCVCSELSGFPESIQASVPVPADHSSLTKLGWKARYASGLAAWRPIRSWSTPSAR
jgi:hypothetical protein